ncbi:hypothetical protein [Aureimonas jatrophae]|jgi:hypothetical protein|uniref:Uncharacterized protein n=1 Tax=Aureimonas jatrophae TaxID=1166073 RepID=A0A1H0HXX1_9HYPH|nr:hypothetical protein [Aureimonas jatrophae]MBB3950834.1 hypothetical protein [Aureimonas jatrophae]SDO24014.1 hypothetical protein SAMN05192530_104341 [Aureimonas jatrophae]
MPLPFIDADRDAIDTVRRLARSQGFLLVSSHEAVGTHRNEGGFMLVDACFGFAVDGFRFDLDVDRARAAILAFAAVGRSQARAEAALPETGSGDRPAAGVRH